MTYASESMKIIKKLVNQVKNYSGDIVNIMEVCGSHTMAIAKFGIRNILPENINLISGPGCPVCVTDNGFIDTAIEISSKKEVILCTFGDLLRIRGKDKTLLETGDAKIVLSPLECLKIAMENPQKEVVFLSIGFETTTPAIALAVQKAFTEKIRNFSVLVANKTMPKILDSLYTDPDFNIGGFIFPGNVCVVSGCSFYEEFCLKNVVKGVVAGFEMSDVLAAISFIINESAVYFQNNYKKFARHEGNIHAREMVSEVFQEVPAFIKGMGVIHGAGLGIKEKYSSFDAEKKFETPIKIVGIEGGCMCGEVIRGKIYPEMCPLFGTKCTLSNPVGSCMVSEEGACSVAFRYSRL